MLSVQNSDETFAIAPTMPQELPDQPESKPEKDLTLQDQLAGFLIKDRGLNKVEDFEGLT